MEAWLTVGKESGEPFEHALVHYNLEESLDVLVLLDLLDRIRLGFFHSVFIIPPAASWSRARHADSAGQFPVPIWGRTLNSRNIGQTSARESFLRFHLLSSGTDVEM